MSEIVPDRLCPAIALYSGDCLDVLKAIEPDSVDAVVTDPPYGLGFMGRHWDHGVPGIEYWRLALRVLKPGGHLVAFSGTRTYHRMVVAIEDSGFEIRDQIGWCYGSGFPKSRDVSKAIDDAAGAERDIVSAGEPVKRMIPGADQHKSGWEKNNGREFVPTITAPATDAAREWQGWGTALKPAWEPIVLARKPLSEGTVAANVLKWRTGALNIDGCRVETTENLNCGAYSGGERRRDEYSSTDCADGAVPLSWLNRGIGDYSQPAGRWPANVVHDGSDEVVGAFPSALGQLAKSREDGAPQGNQVYGAMKHGGPVHVPRVEESVSAARFFYSAKADSDDRIGSKHPTVKPVDLMRWLVRLVAPPGALVLDPFAGTGTTAEACMREGFRCILIEREPEYQSDIRRRIKLAMAGPDERAREIAKAKHKDKPVDLGPLFSAEAAE